MIDGINHTGGVFIDVVSVCYPNLGYKEHRKYPYKEVAWAHEDLSKSSKDYYLEPGANL